MKRMRRALAAAGLATASVAGLIAFAGTASAATGGIAPYNGVCGAGYQVIDFADITSTTATEATVYLTWNNTTGKNCVVTVRRVPGAPVRMTAEVAQAEHALEFHSSDDGQYTTYAGPVYVPARGECVRWRGSTDGGIIDRTGHCG